MESMATIQKNQGGTKLVVDLVGPNDSTQSLMEKEMVVTNVKSRFF